MKIVGARCFQRARFYPFSARNLGGNLSGNSANSPRNSRTNSGVNFTRNLRTNENLRVNLHTNLSKNSRKFYAIIGLGANMRDEKFTLKKLFRLFMDDRRIKVLESSALFINKAFGYEKQRDFTNAVLLAQSLLHARNLLKILLFYEFKFRRQRSFKNAPRILDIDLLYFSKKCKNDKFCTLPHPGAAERISVILPLGEILQRRAF